MAQMMKKKVVILGSTGSIGQNTIRVVEALSDRFEIIGLAAKRNITLLVQQAAKLGCRDLAVSDTEVLPELKRIAPDKTYCAAGERALVNMVTRPEVDVVLCAIVGTGGLRPVLAALRAGKRVALASKEVMVMAGDLMNAELFAGHGEMITVDSEHSAIFQCLNGHAPEEVKKLILTASGGPFRTWSQDEIARASVREALAHPTWKMGRKITIDSATLMNKALEIIEAHYLFRTPADKISVLIHPQSLVHSMVEMMDGAVFAQISPPDMRLAIQYAMTYPKRADGGLAGMDWSKPVAMEFYEPDRTKFPSLDFAYEALRKGGTAPAVLNAANEMAVEAFLRGSIHVPDVWHCVETVLNAHTPEAQRDLENVLAADAWARAKAAEYLEKIR